MFSVPGLSFALFASFLWAALDAVRKRLATRFPAVSLVVLLTAGQLPLLLAFLLFGGAETWTIPWERYAGPGLLIVLLNTTANVAFVRAVEVSPLSRTIPFLSLTPVFALFAAWWLVNEVPSATQVLGVFLVVGGALGLGFGRSNAGRGGFRFELGSLIMSGVALLWALTATLDKVALAHVSAPLHAFLQGMGTLGLLLAFVAARGEARTLAPQGNGLCLGLAVVLGLSATLAQYMAIQLVWVSIVEVIKRTVGGLMSLVLGRLAFGERVTLASILAVGTMIWGTIFVLDPL